MFLHYPVLVIGKKTRWPQETLTLYYDSLLIVCQQLDNPEFQNKARERSCVTTLDNVTKHEC